MNIWVCIPVFNRIEFTRKCLTTFRSQTFQRFTVVICDHGSTDGTSEYLKREFPEVVVLNADSSLWWTGAMNVCVKYVLQHAQTDDYLLTLNNDTQLPSDYLTELAANAHKYPRAVLTSVIHDIETDKCVSVGNRENWFTAKALSVSFENHHLPGDDSVIEVTHASGRGTLFPIVVFSQLGLYDEAHLPHYGADYDFTHKARRAGFPIYVCQACKVLSHVQANGMTAIRNKFSLESLINYLTSTKSPANLNARWWYAWNNCPKWLLPSYIVVDITRIVGSYFKYFLFAKA
jgi:GT2 family glycosyltransferase